MIFSQAVISSLLLVGCCKASSSRIDVNLRDRQSGSVPEPWYTRKDLRDDKGFGRFWETKDGCTYTLYETTPDTAAIETALLRLEEAKANLRAAKKRIVKKTLDSSYHDQLRPMGTPGYKPSDSIKKRNEWKVDSTVWFYQTDAKKWVNACVEEVIPIMNLQDYEKTTSKHCNDRNGRVTLSGKPLGSKADIIFKDWIINTTHELLKLAYKSEINQSVFAYRHLVQSQKEYEELMGI